MIKDDTGVIVTWAKWGYCTKMAVKNGWAETFAIESLNKEIRHKGFVPVGFVNVETNETNPDTWPKDLVVWVAEQRVHMTFAQYAHTLIEDHRRQRDDSSGWAWRLKLWKLKARYWILSARGE